RYQYWDSYAGEQQFRLTGPKNLVDYTQAGITPLERFVGNSCTTAQNSFMTIGNTAPSDIYDPPLVNLDPSYNDLAPPFPDENEPFSAAADPYYPKVPYGGSRSATLCPTTGNCSQVSACAYKATEKCTITSIDHYTSSFNFAQIN